MKMDDTTLKKLDEAICLICDEMSGRRTERVVALAGILRDLVFARAILKENTMCQVKELEAETSRSKTVSGSKQSCFVPVIQLEIRGVSDSNSDDVIRKYKKSFEESLFTVTSEKRSIF